MQGALDSLTDYLYIIVALVIGAMMFFFVTGRGSLFDSEDEAVIFGDKNYVSQRLAEEIENCWELHRRGLDSESAVCSEFRVNSTDYEFSEWSVSKELDCEFLPNAECLPGNCSFCATGGAEDNLDWEVPLTKNSYVAITYSGSERIIKVMDVLETDLSGTSGNDDDPNASPLKVFVSATPVNPSQYDKVDFNSMVTGNLSLLESVEIYFNDSLVQTCYAQTCSQQLGPFEVGNYSYYAIVRDNLGKNRTSREKTLKVANLSVKNHDVLIVALKANMQKDYSAAQIDGLEDKVADFQTTLLKESLGSQFIYLDSDEVEAMVGKKVTSDKLDCWKCARSVIIPLVEKLDAKYVIILGGQERFPQALVMSTGSDSAYGDLDGDGNYLMDIPVGRILDPNNDPDGMDLMIKTLDTAIRVHEAGGLDLTEYKGPVRSCGGIDGNSQSTGHCFCEAVFESGCQDCGDCCGDIDESALDGMGFVFIQAHGPGSRTRDKEDFFHGGGVDVGTELMSQIDVEDSFWISRSCSGGYILGKETIESSMPMSFLDNGGAAYIASTDTNWGEFVSGCPIPGGDSCIGALDAEMGMALEKGARLGDCYVEGKNNYFTKYHEQGYRCYDGPNYHYQITCFYGDPTIKIKDLWDTSSS